MQNAPPEPVLSVGATLGEGPVWIGSDQALWFVDIESPTVHRYDPICDEHRQWNAPCAPGWILPASNGALLAGLKTGINTFDRENGGFEVLHAPEQHLPRNRLNDAATDPSGRLWFGSKDDTESRACGRLYRFAKGQCVDSGMPPAVITNGPAISPNGDRLYHVDTLGKVILVADIDDIGMLGPPRRFAAIEDGAGYPDGAVCDAEGCVWLGLFSGWSVRRYDPDGRLMQTVRFPVANVTKIAFGGPNLDVAYATTARTGLTSEALRQQPLAGDLFAFDPGVKGLPVTPALI